MIDKLSLFLNINDFKELKSHSYEINGFKIISKTFFSKTNNLKVSIWNSTNLSNFIKVITEKDGQEFSEVSPDSQLQIKHFFTYFKSLENLSANQLNLIVSYLENQLYKIKYNYQHFLEIPPGSAYLLSQTIVKDLKEYLFIMELLNQHQYSDVVQLYNLLNSQISEIIQEFNSELLTPENPLIKDKVDSFYNNLIK